MSDLTTILAITGWALLIILIASIGYNKFKTSKEYARMFQTEEHPETVMIFRDSSGNKWYSFKDPAKLPASRLLASEVAFKFAEMNVTAPVLLQWIDSMVEALNQGDLQQLGMHLGRLRERLDYAGEEETLLKVANVYFLIEGENPSDMTNEMTAKKMDIFKNDVRARGFFLVASWRLTKAVSEVSDNDILEYLREVRVNLSEKSS